MASTREPLGDQFPRFHPVCDCCGQLASVGLRQAVRGHLGTPAGEFAYQVCIACDAVMDELPVAALFATKVDAAVRHADFYSAEYGQFIADWFGIDNPKFKANQEAA